LASSVLETQARRSPAAILKLDLLVSYRIDEITQLWEALCERTADDNAYYTPGYARALLNNINKGDVIFVLAWDSSDLIGLLPVTRQEFAVPFLGSGGSAWRTKYTFGCMPLIDRDRADAAAELLLDGLTALGPAEWVLPTVNAQGASCAALVRSLNRRGAPWFFANSFQRASLESSCSYDEYTQRHLAPKRRKGIERNRRRLQELGTLTFESHTDGAGLERAVTSFLDVEASGWKGRKGTALACAPADAAFARAAFTTRMGQSSCRADLLLLDGKAIAVSLTIFAGRTGFTIKCCYDEDFRSFSPGLVLELEMIRSLLTDKWADRLDAATAGSHVIDGLWSDRIEVADLAFSLAPRHAHARLKVLGQIMAMRQRLKSTIKSLIARVRDARDTARRAIAFRRQKAIP
jgi:CelD/BcsL family acetyltransferase involved in cellulose biosynthesis